MRRNLSKPRPKLPKPNLQSKSPSAKLPASSANFFRRRAAKDVLFEGQYGKGEPKGECPNTNAAVLIDGKGAGSIFYLCQTEKCEVHNRVTRYQPTPQEQVQRRKEALAERGEKLSRVRILEAVRKKLPDVLSRPDLEMVALDYFRCLAASFSLSSRNK